MSQIIFRGECISSDDPLRLGRIRAIPTTEDEAQLYSSTLVEGQQNYAPWDSKDPFLYKPLLPFFNNVSPKQGEYIHLIYSDPNRKQNLERYYVGGVYSSPTTVKNEPYNSALSNLELGTRNQKFPNIFNNDGELFNKKSEGVFLDPKDVSIQGRGSSDIIVKEDTVLIRSGKNLPFERGDVPNAYNERAFFQLSKFNQTTKFGSPSKKKRIESPYEDIKILVEYYITNPQTTSTGFTGSINVYNVKPGPKSNSKNFLTSGTKNELEIGEDISLRVNISTQQPILKSKFSKLVEETIRIIAQGGNLLQLKSLDLDYALFVEVNGSFSTFSSNNLPIYFRPTIDQFTTFEYSLNALERNNLNDLFSNISIKSESNRGYGLVFDEKLSDKPKLEVKDEIIIPKSTQNIINTTSLLGSDSIYLLSHKSKKSGSDRINLDNTLYGIDEGFISDEIEPKTSSMVRGEELINLLDKIIQFLISHVHAYHGKTPVSVAEGGNVTKSDLLNEIEESYNKILNQNIRIN